MTKVHFPEIEKAGGLIFALNIAFTKIGSTLRVSNNYDPKFFPGTYARIEKNNKFSQIYIAAEEKLYLPDFWRDGVCLGHGKTDNIELLAKCIDLWLTTAVSTKQLSDKFNFVVPDKDAAIFDEGKEVEHKWQSILHDPHKKEIKSFVKLAINDKVLSRLFPFTSLYTLCFSRCTGFPYDTINLPSVTPKQFENFISSKHIDFKQQETNQLEGQFVVTLNKEKFLGIGSAEEALKIVKANLPDNVQPARKGTAAE